MQRARDGALSSTGAIGSPLQAIMSRFSIHRSSEPMFRKTALTALLVLTAAFTVACKPSAPAAVRTTSPTAATPAPDASPAVVEAPAPKPALPPEACTLEGGREFFQQFVESADVRRAYSRLDLKAGIAADAAAAHPQFDGFRIGLVDNRWVLVDPATAAADAPRVELKRALQGNTYTVDYTRARFSNNDETVEPYGETARYTFEFVDGCWALVSQTPAP
jgi:hypothetical protein